MRKRAPYIVIVEDDVWLGQQFERTLRKHGYEVRVTTNALAAMDLIDERCPDGIILDMLLGGSTGLALVHELQSYRDTGAIPVVVCTNLAAGLVLRDLEPYGVRRMLDKTTMQPDDLVAAVRSVLA